MYKGKAYKLSSKRVDLGAIDDIRSALDKAAGAYKEGSIFASKASKQFQDAKSLYRNAIKVAEDSENFLKEAAKKGFPMAGADTQVSKMKREAEEMYDLVSRHKMNLDNI